MFYFFLLLLIFPPLTYYGLDQQWTSGFFEVATGLFFLLLVYQVLRHKRNFLSVPGLIPLGCYCCLLLFQLIPLPPPLLSFLSPTAFAHYQETIWLLDPGVWMPVTIFPKVTLLSFFRFSSYAIFFVITVQVLHNSDRLKKTALVLSCFGGVYAFVGLLQFFTPGHRILWVMAPWPERLSHAFGSYINGNHYSGLMEMLFPLSVTCFFLCAPKSSYGNWRDKLADFVSDPSASKHIYVGVSAVFIAVSIFFSLSRGGIISLVLSTLILLGLLFYRLKNRQKSLIFILLLISVMGLVGFVGWQPIIQRFERVFNSTGGIADQRPVFWQDSLELIKDYPLLGTGHGSFVDSYQSYQSINIGELVVRHVHNDYLEILTDTGFLGFCLVAWFLVTVVWQTWSAWKRRRNSASRYLYLGALCGIIAILLHSVTDFNFAIPPNGSFFFFLCGLLVASANVRSRGPRINPDWVNISSRQSWLLIFLGLVLISANILFAGGILRARSIYTPFAELNPEKFLPEQQLKQLALIQAAARWDPLESDYRYAEGIFFKSLQQQSAAQLAFQTAVMLRPFNGFYLQQTGLQVAASGNDELAGQLLAAGVQVQPMRFLRYQEYGLWLLHQKRQAEAFTTFQQGLEKQPAMTGSILTLLAFARIEPEQMIQVIPNRAQSWQIYADYLAGLEKDKAAEAAYARAIKFVATEIRPNTKPYWSFYRFLRKKKQDSEALTLMLDGIDHFPNNAGFHRNAGQLYEKQGVVYRAIEEYQQALLIDPKHGWVKKRLNKLQSK